MSQSRIQISKSYLDKFRHELPVKKAKLLSNEHFQLRIDHVLVKFCSKQIIDELSLRLFITIHGLVLENKVFQRDDINIPSFTSATVDSPSSHRFLTEKDPGTVVFSPAGA